MLILYKSSPNNLEAAPPVPLPPTISSTGYSSPPPPILTSIPSPVPALAPAPAPTVVQDGPRAGAGFVTLDVLGHIDRGVGKLIGDPALTTAGGLSFRRG